MTRKYVKLKDYKGFEENPFVEKAIAEIKVVKRQQVIRPANRNEIQMIVSSDGVVEGYTAFMRFVEVDEAQFAKVYISQFAAFWELTKPAIRVFGYILTALKPKSDSFFFNLQLCKEHTGYNTNKSIFEGITALIDCNIIARSSNHNIYFINPLVVFNGDRVSFAKTYIKKKREDSKTINLKDAGPFAEDIPSEKQPGNIREGEKLVSY
jgi:hypothetical protein